MWSPRNDETHLWRKGKGLFTGRGMQEIFLLCLFSDLVSSSLTLFFDMQLSGLLKEVGYTEAMVYKF